MAVEETRVVLIPDRASFLRVQRELADLGRNIDLDRNLDIGSRAISQVRDIEAAIRGIPDIDVRANIEDAEIENVARRIRGIADDLDVEIDVEALTAGARDELDRLERDGTLTVTARADIESALADLERLERDRQATVTALADAERAEGDLDALERAREANITATADVSRALADLDGVARDRSVDIDARADTARANGELDDLERSRTASVFAEGRNIPAVERTLDGVAERRIADIFAEARGVPAADRVLDGVAERRDTLIDVGLRGVQDARRELDDLAQDRTTTVTARVIETGREAVGRGRGIIGGIAGLASGAALGSAQTTELRESTAVLRAADQTGFGVSGLDALRREARQTTGVELDNFLSGFVDTIEKFGEETNEARRDPEKAGESGPLGQFSRSERVAFIEANTPEDQFNALLQAISNAIDRDGVGAGLARAREAGADDEFAEFLVKAAQNLEGFTAGVAAQRAGSDILTEDTARRRADTLAEIRRSEQAREDAARRALLSPAALGARDLLSNTTTRVLNTFSGAQEIFSGGRDDSVSRRINDIEADAETREIPPALQAELDALRAQRFDRENREAVDALELLRSQSERQSALPETAPVEIRELFANDTAQAAIDARAQLEDVRRLVENSDSAKEQNERMVTALENLMTMAGDLVVAFDRLDRTLGR